MNELRFTAWCCRPPSSRPVEFASRIQRKARVRLLGMRISTLVRPEGAAVVPVLLLLLRCNWPQIAFTISWRLRLPSRLRSISSPNCVRISLRSVPRSQVSARCPLGLYCAKYPEISTIRCVASLANALTHPLVVGTIAGRLCQAEGLGGHPIHADPGGRRDL